MHTVEGDKATKKAQQQKKEKNLPFFAFRSISAITTTTGTTGTTATMEDEYSSPRPRGGRTPPPAGHTKAGTSRRPINFVLVTEEEHFYGYGPGATSNHEQQQQRRDCSRRPSYGRLPSYRRVFVEEEEEGDEGGSLYQHGEEEKQLQQSLPFPGPPPLLDSMSPVMSSRGFRSAEPESLFGESMYRGGVGGGAGITNTPPWRRRRRRRGSLTFADVSQLPRSPGSNATRRHSSRSENSSNSTLQCDQSNNESSCPTERSSSLTSLPPASPPMAGRKVN